MKKRNRGRLSKSMVPPTLAIHPFPDIQPEMLSATRNENNDENNKCDNGKAEEIPEETLKGDSEENLEYKSMAHKLWVDVLSENQNPVQGKVFKFIAPTVINGKVETDIDEDDADLEIQFWSNSLIMYVIGGRTKHE